MTRKSVAKLTWKAKAKNKDSAKDETEVEEEGLPPTKRKKQVCTYCKLSGHINRIIRGRFACPMRLHDFETE